MDVDPKTAPLELPVTKCGLIPEVPLVQSLEIKDIFSVELVRQQMTANDKQDVPLDEPGLDLEPDDDFDKGSSISELDNEGLEAP